MKFGIKNPDKLNGVIYKEDMPLLILDNADGEITMDMENNIINVELLLDELSQEEVQKLFVD